MSEYLDEIIELDQPSDISHQENVEEEVLETKPEPAKDLSEFEKKMEQAIKQSKGIHTGLCMVCLSTNYIFVRGNDYSGIEYKYDEERNIKLTKCNHGQETPEEDFGY
jgi:hypothetical protein